MRWPNISSATTTTRRNGICCGSGIGQASPPRKLRAMAITQIPQSVREVPCKFLGMAVSVAARMLGIGRKPQTSRSVATAVACACFGRPPRESNTATVHGWFAAHSTTNSVQWPLALEVPGWKHGRTMLAGGLVGSGRRASCGTFPAASVVKM